jgi:large subunit ribosomal protein L17
MAVIELVSQKTVTDEAERARRVRTSQKAATVPATEEETAGPTADQNAVDEAEGSTATASESGEAVTGVAESASTEDAPYGEGSHAPLDDPAEAPEGFEIKGNADSMLYHVPGSAFYDRTVAEVWFDSAESAEAAGFQLPPSQRDDTESEESDS